MAQKLDKPNYVLTATEILSLGATEIRMLIEKLLPKKGLAALTGSSDGGKSFLLLYLALLICSNEEEVFGLKINRQYGSVIFVCTEETAEEICVRLSSLLKRKISLTDNDKLRFVFDSHNLLTKLSDELIRQPADVIIIDTLGDLFIGNLNDSIAVRQFLKQYKKIASDYGCLILFNHHIGKGKENNTNPSKNDVLGSQGIESACRTVLMLRKKSDGKRELTVVKGNHMSEEYKNRGIVLNFDPIKGFETTGETVHFTNTKSNPEVDEALEKEVVQLYSKLKSYKRVAEELRKKGRKIDKNRVGYILKKSNNTIPSISENDGRIIGKDCLKPNNQ